MGERPILFSGPMVRGLLTEGPTAKLQTRRLAKGDKPYAAVGDVLRVRESFRLPSVVDDRSPLEAPGLTAAYGYPLPPCWYEADGALSRPYPAEWGWGGPGKLRPGIHLPTALVRIRLEVTAVRLERLHEISDADAIAEGVMTLPGTGDPEADTPVRRFARLWGEINGPDSRGRNPLVWVVSFRRVP